MKSETLKYIDKIIKLDTLSDSQILQLEKELNIHLQTLSEKEQTEFAESGYGEALYMVCSGIRYENNK